MERQREFAVRVAIGARRWRLVRQVIVEAAVLAVIACGLGLAIAYVAVRGFVGFTSQFVPQLAEVTLDARLMLFAVGLTVSAALCIGLWPAIKLSRGGVQDGLKETATGLTASVHRRRLASALIVGEVALAVVLLAGAGLLLRSVVTVARSVSSDGPLLQTTSCQSRPLPSPPANISRRYASRCAAAVSSLTAMVRTHGRLPSSTT